MTSTLWLPLALLSAVLTAFTALAGKIGVASVSSTTAAFVRTVFMLLTLVLFMLASGRLNFGAGIGTKPLIALAISGVAGTCTWLFFFWSLKVGDASKVVPIDNLSILFAVVLAGVFLQEKIGWKGGVGAILMVAGAVLIAAK